MLLRIRRAIVQDTVARHGLSLTTDARALLVEPGSEQTTLREAAQLVTKEVLRRLNPALALAAAARGLEVYALGHLLDRYITRFRRTSAVRVHADEARWVRDAVDRAVRRALSPSLQASFTVLPSGTEDLREGASNSAFIRTPPSTLRRPVPRQVIKCEGCLAQPRRGEGGRPVEPSDTEYDHVVETLTADRANDAPTQAVPKRRLTCRRRDGYTWSCT
jgi:hypothetical protein